MAKKNQRTSEGLVGEAVQGELDLGLPRHIGIEDVKAFQEKFKVPMHYFPRLLDDETFMYRFQFFGEELFEILSAHRDGDLVKFADGLIDLAYITYGTALMAGLGDVWPKLWARVQQANMSKVRATSKADSKRGSKLDIVKPADWQSPDNDMRAIILECIKRKGKRND